MIFYNRDDVEAAGRAGIATVRDESGLRAKQLDRFWLYVDESDEGYTKHALMDGFWESWITLWMSRNVPAGSRCLDIGANHGYYTFFLASRGSEVWAAEPQPVLADLIRKSETVNNEGVHVLEAAFSDTSGVMEMMVPVGHGMNATISNEFSYAPNGYGTISVDTMRLDDVGIEFGFIKVDAEGAEDLIWAGSKDYRKRNPDTLWLMEWRWDRYKSPEQFGQDILDGYEVHHVNYQGDEEPVETVEFLASRKHEDWMLVLRKK